jgi:GNAT superfamily N-acetyltransferase
VDSKLRIDHLTDHSEVLPIPKEWFETAWESYYGPVGSGDAQRDPLAYANRGELPIGVVAFYENELCGVAALTSASMIAHSHLGPWVVACLVSPSYQRRGIGTAMGRILEEVAKNLGYACISCGTSTAGHLLERRG